MWVYKLTNTTNGKVYVGKTGDLEQRWKEHRRGKGSGAIGRAFRKYGAGAFDFAILESGVATESELSRLEIEWIAKLGSHGSLGGYNMTLGGEGSRLTDEMKAARKAAGQWPSGRKPSDATRALWSAQRKGKAPSEACKQASRIAAARPKSLETRRLLSESMHRRNAQPGYVEALAAKQRGVPKSAAHREAIRKSARKRSTARIIEHEGVSKNLADWAIEAGISAAILSYRLKKGWPMQEALGPVTGRRRA